MPIQVFECLSGHTTDKWLPAWAELGVRTMLCEECGHTMGPALSVGRGLTYFEEGRARTIWNLGPHPVTVRSHGEHRRLMREAGVEHAGRRYGEKGCWV